MKELKALEIFNNELQRRCNGLSNPNHVLEVALQMQKEIYAELEALIYKYKGMK